MRIRHIFDGATFLAVLALLAMGCGAVRNPALENARADYHKAQQDPAIVRHASVALERAARALEAADQRWTGLHWTGEEDVIEVEHLAYIAEKRVEIARATAQRRLAIEEIQQIRRARPNP
jgi:hypothetical protein